MNKGIKIYLAVLSVVTIIAVVAGIVINIFGSWNKFGLPRIHVGGDVEMVSGEEMLDEDITSLNVDISVADVQIVTGDGFDVEYNLPKELVPDISVESGTLVIKSKKNITLNNWGYGNDFESYYFNITVPEDAKFKNVEINMDLGNCEADAFTCDKFDANIDCGNLEVDELTAKDITAILSMGNISVNNAKFEKGDIACDMGNIEISGKFDKLEANCDMGDIEIKNDNKDADYDLDCDMGDIEVNGISYYN